MKTQDVIMQTGKAAQRFGLLVEELSVCVKGITEFQISYGITDSGANFGKSQDFPEKLLNRKKSCFSESSSHHTDGLFLRKVEVV